MAKETQLDFFISYTGADCNWGEWIAWTLEEAGYTTILQAWDFRPASNFVLQMQKAAREAERTIAVLSPGYLDATYTQPEWAAAFVQDPKGEQGTLLLVRVRECRPEGLLAPIVYIDLVGKDQETAREALLAGVQRERAKPSRAPVFPGGAERSVKERPVYPPLLPRIWNVPHDRNPNFTGREDILDELRGRLTAEGTAAVTQAIHGLGGVGKTELAVEHAYRHKDDYQVVWWIRAEEPAKLAADYAMLATPLGLGQRELADQTVIVAAVKRWLGEHGDWLLVFDNVPHPDDVRPFVPQGGAGHTICTSRDPNWRSLCEPLPLDVWPAGESVQFLLNRTGLDDAKGAAELAETLGHLPLALEQAAAYIETRGESFAGYLKLYRKHKLDVLESTELNTREGKTVATTWEISFKRVKEESAAAADLLNLCAFLASEDIPKELFCDHHGLLPRRLGHAVSDPRGIDDVVAVLRGYSLIETSGNFFCVHRLVQTVLRDRLSARPTVKWAEAATSLLTAAFPCDSGDVGTWPISAVLLPHAEAIAQHAEELGLFLDSATHLLNQVGRYLRGRAQFTEARSRFERALRIDEATHGPQDPKVARDVNNLGNVFWDLGDLPAARTHHERALRIDETAFGPDDSRVATDINNLGNVLIDLGDVEGARAHLQRALTIDEAAHGSDDLTVGRDLNNLGEALRAGGDFAGAGAHFGRALAIFEKTLGPHHPDTATVVNNLGGVFLGLGDLPTARIHLERALRIDEAAYGQEHPKVATDVVNLGGVLVSLGDLAGARSQAQRALAIYCKFFGDDHPNASAMRRNLEYIASLEKSDD